MAGEVVSGVVPAVDDVDGVGGGKGWQQQAAEEGQEKAPTYRIFHWRSNIVILEFECNQIVF